MKKRELIYNGENYSVKAEVSDDTLLMELDGETRINIPFKPIGPGEGICNADGKRYSLVAAEDKNSIWVSVNGRTFKFDIKSDDDVGGAGEDEHLVAAPMPGKVIKLLAQLGDAVNEGDAVIIVEAMKMEHTLRAPMSGKIIELKCEEGQQVDANVPLLEIEEAAGD